MVNFDEFYEPYEKRVLELLSEHEEIPDNMLIRVSAICLANGATDEQILEIFDIKKRSTTANTELFEKVTRDLFTVEDIEISDMGVKIASTCLLEGVSANAVVTAFKDDWADRVDEYSDKIKEAHPLRSKAYKEYALAMRMVGDRKSKAELVDLVCWLLQKTDINNL